VAAFMPGSQVDIRPIHDLDQYVEPDIPVKILKLTGSAATWWFRAKRRSRKSCSRATTALSTSPKEPSSRTP
jgi:ribosomal protein S1